MTGTALPPPDFDALEAALTHGLSIDTHHDRAYLVEDGRCLGVTVFKDYPSRSAAAKHLVWAVLKNLGWL